MAAPDAARGLETARLAALSEYARDGVVLADANRAIVYVNRATETLLGHRAEDLLGRNPGEFVHPDDWDAYERVLERFGARSESSMSVQVRLRHADGRWRLFDCSVRNLLDDARVQGVAVFMDGGMQDDKLICAPEAPTLATRLAVGGFLLGYGMAKRLRYWRLGRKGATGLASIRWLAVYLGLAVAMGLAA